MNAEVNGQMLGSDWLIPPAAIEEWLALWGEGGPLRVNIRVYASCTGRVVFGEIGTAKQLRDVIELPAIFECLSERGEWAEDFQLREHCERTIENFHQLVGMLRWTEKMRQNSG